MENEANKVEDEEEEEERLKKKRTTTNWGSELKLHIKQCTINYIPQFAAFFSFFIFIGISI